MKKKRNKCSKAHMRKVITDYLIKKGVKEVYWNMPTETFAQIIADFSGIKNGNSRRVISLFYTHLIKQGFVSYSKTIENRTSKTVKKIDYVASDEFLLSYEWKKVRYDALKLSDGKCSLCGKSRKDGIILNVDHIKPRKTHPELALEITNLQVLCGDCNHGKGNRDDTDWR